MFARKRDRVMQTSYPNVALHATLPVLEWCAIKCGSKNKDQIDTCLQENGLRVQNVLII